MKDPALQVRDAGEGSSPRGEGSEELGRESLGQLVRAGFLSAEASLSSPSS